MTDQTSAELHASTGPSGEVMLRLVGRLDATGAAAIWNATLSALRQSAGQPLIVDAQGVSYCDGTGAALLQAMARFHGQTKGSFQLRGFPAEFEPLLKMFDGADPADAAPSHVRIGVVEFVGMRTSQLVRDVHGLIAAFGELIVVFAKAALRPRSVRWRDVLAVAEQAGVNAAPVVILIGFLTGLVMGFQSAIVFHDYGADVYLGRFLGETVVRELGPLMTAIVLTARSGSAFAAEIGTMQINEEVAALRTMGIDPTRFLILPRVIAAVAMTPILTTLTNLAGLIGGALVSVFTLGLPLTVYTNSIRESVNLTDLFGGLAKSLAFGMLVAAVSCLRGLQTSGGATGVGDSTTRAVVSGIVLIALADCLFAFVYYYLGI